MLFGFLGIIVVGQVVNQLVGEVVNQHVVITAAHQACLGIVVVAFGLGKPIPTRHNS
jgi:hypothetical protein